MNYLIIYLNISVKKRIFPLDKLIEMRYNVISEYRSENLFYRKVQIIMLMKGW